MKVIQITEEKKEKISEGLEKMLRIGGKLMQCVESLEEEDDDEAEAMAGMRGGYRRGGMRGGRRGGMREDDYYDMPDPDMGMRRGGMRSRYDIGE